MGFENEVLKMEPLTPFGGFSVRNALRTVPPNETKAIVVQFEPFAQQIYEEKLLLFSRHTVVSVTLKGRGVRPEIRIEPEDGLLYFGNILAGESAEKEFKVRNVSAFAVKFKLVLKADGVQNKSGFKVVHSTALSSLGIYFHSRGSNDRS